MESGSMACSFPTDGNPEKPMDPRGLEQMLSYMVANNPKVRSVSTPLDDISAAHETPLPMQIKGYAGWGDFARELQNINGRTPPETECPVPLEQQPVNEYQSLSTSFPFNWAAADIVEYCSRLLAVGSSFAVFVGLPVAWLGSVGPQSEPLKPALAAVSSGLFVVTLAVVRMYLGWILTVSVAADEETGWYDGQVYCYGAFHMNLPLLFTQPLLYMAIMTTNYDIEDLIWVKTAEVLARDRLLGSFSVKPVLSRLKNTLVGLAASLFLCAVLLINLEGNQKSSYVSSGEPGGRAVPGVYNDESARLFEPDAFCGEPDLQ
ncbi:hypothetical protein RHSIM_Rhsim11G0044300 [Rhododendron simsii]|uniref:Uncharacterized protein n=1 Tax=Rhododendron simsii TaxID=118357 RepID=A0A834LAX8_RHOSS|nr:hypothetical protein RHSIM_Rhsim11G0044300 [Rhododendron simsii]